MWFAFISRKDVEMRCVRNIRDRRCIDMAIRSGKYVQNSRDKVDPHYVASHYGTLRYIEKYCLQYIYKLHHIGRKHRRHILKKWLELDIALYYTRTWYPYRIDNSGKPNGRILYGLEVIYHIATIKLSAKREYEYSSPYAYLLYDYTRIMAEESVRLRTTLLPADVRIIRSITSYAHDDMDRHNSVLKYSKVYANVRITKFIHRHLGYTGRLGHIDRFEYVRIQHKGLADESPNTFMAAVRSSVGNVDNNVHIPIWTMHGTGMQRVAGIQRETLYVPSSYT